MENNFVTTIVCYTGGTCGDLITALLDPRDVSIVNGIVKHAEERCRLKKPHLFVDDLTKDQYLEYVCNRYRSISSHDLEYHKQRKHNFISITVQDKNIARWAAERFKSLHRPQVWQEMSKYCGANDIDSYAQIMIDYSNMVVKHAAFVVKLEEILSGAAIDRLRGFFGSHMVSESEKFYQTWLQHATSSISHPR